MEWLVPSSLVITYEFDLRASVCWCWMIAVSRK
jgi:hypothetical protein